MELDAQRIVVTASPWVVGIKAGSVMKRYKDPSQTDRRAVLAFLHSQVAPPHPPERLARRSRARRR